MRPVRASACLSLLALPIAVACGGGGGGGGPTTPPVPASLVYVASSNPTAAAFALRATESTPTSLTLVLEARGVDGLNGLACDVVYPSALRFDGFTPGDLLTSGGATQSLQVVESPPGRVVIGATRIGAAGLPAAQGVVATLRFSAVATGSGAISFQESRAFDDRGGTLGALSWVGGTVTVVR